MKNLSLIVIVFLFLIAAPITALSCSCARNDDIEANFNIASVVVTATALDVTNSKVASKRMSRSDYKVETQTIVWEIQEVWKGPYKAKDKLTTVTEVVCCVCGMTAQKSDVLILYLYDKAPYSLSMCSRTASLKNSRKDLPKLRKLKQRRESGT